MPVIFMMVAIVWCDRVKIGLPHQVGMLVIANDVNQKWNLTDSI